MVWKDPQGGEQSAIIDSGSSTDLVAAPGANRRVVLTAYSFCKTTAGTVKLQSGASTDLTGAMKMADTQHANFRGRLACDEDEKLNVVLGAGSVEGHFSYIIQYDDGN
jgi:hypothetical protein